ncbi:MAG: DUF3597 family protein, partial [Gemmatimonadales bacterium]
MGLFSSILEKLGMKRDTPDPVTPTPTQPVRNVVPMVDVVAQLEQRAKANPQKLNWRTSIVDLLKL